MMIYDNKLILGGIVATGKIEVNKQCKLGPDLNGNFK